MLDDTEIWKAAPSWEGLYEVSSLGRIRTVERIVRVASVHHASGFYERLVPTRIRATPRRGKYRQIMLSDGKRRSCYDVHTLVCEAFHGPRPDGHECAHGDGNGANNSAANLRWATSSENHEDKRRHGTLLQGSAIGSAKLSEEDVVEIRRRRHESASSLATEFGVHRVHIYKLWRNDSWIHVLAGENDDARRTSQAA